MRVSSRRTVASAGTSRRGSTGSGRTPSRPGTCGGASAIHSATAGSEVAPASTAHAVSARTTASACRTPRGSHSARIARVRHLGQPLEQPGYLTGADVEVLSELVKGEWDRG